MGNAPWEIIGIALVILGIFYLMKMSQETHEKIEELEYKLDEMYKYIGTEERENK